MDYSRYEFLDVTRSGAVVTVSLNRPEVRNVAHEGLHDELATIFADLDRDDECDVVILTGAGGFFCGGGDLNWLLEIHGSITRTAHGNKSNQRIQTSLLALEKPIIAKVRGAAIGLGSSLALCCDFVYATPDAQFADPHVRVGLVAGDGGTYLWPLLVGYARARRYLLTGDAVAGAEAERIGLITAAVADDELDATVEKLAQRLVGAPRYALRWTKSSINAGLRVVADPVLHRGSVLEQLTFMSEDSRIAFEAFQAGQRPTFTGR